MDFKWLAIFFILISNTLGCAPRNLPPPVSLSKFVRSPGDDGTSGKLALTSALDIYGEQDGDGSGTTLFEIPPFFRTEGSLSFWLGNRYDLTLSVHSVLLMSLEGNLAIVSNERFRIGILHGAGLAYIGEKWEGSVVGEADYFLNLSAGIIAQIQTELSFSFFLGFKYTYATIGHIKDSQGGSQSESTTHYFTGSVGYVFERGVFRITPEISVNYGDWRYIDSDESGHLGIWIIQPSFTVGVVY